MIGFVNNQLYPEVWDSPGPPDLLGRHGARMA